MCHHCKAMRALYHRPVVTFFGNDWIDYPEDLLGDRRWDLNCMASSFMVPPEMKDNNAMKELNVLAHAIEGIQKSIKLVLAGIAVGISNTGDESILAYLHNAHRLLMDRIDVLHLRLHLDFLQIERIMQESTGHEGQSAVERQAEDFEDSDSELPSDIMCQL